MKCAVRMVVARDSRDALGSSATCGFDVYRLGLSSAANQWINGPNGTHSCVDKQPLFALVRTWHPVLPEMLQDGGQRPRASLISDLAERMLSRSRTVKS